MPETLVAALERAASLDRPGTGLRYLDRQERPTFFTWPDVVARARRVAGALAAAGVRPGDRVGIVLPTSPAFTDTFFGCQLLGAVPVPLYPPVRLGRLTEYHERTAAMLRSVEARAVVVDRLVGRVFGQVLAHYTPPCGLIDAEGLLEGPDRAPVAAREDDLAMVQFSSGTTTHPKPVALTHGAVMAQVRGLLERLEPDREPEPAGVTWLPLYHDMGLIGCVFVAVVHPGALTLIAPENFLARPAVWLRALSTWGGAISPAPNFAYALCVERIRDEELEGCDLSRWRVALNGAEPIAAATQRAFQERFARWGFRPEALSPVYGLSEASLAVTFSDLDAPFRSVRFDSAALAEGRAVPTEDGVELVSVGTPMPGFRVRIAGEAGDLPEDRVGRILTAGPSLLAGYLNGAPSPVVDGWLDTGDLGFQHDGELYVTGRAKDLIVLRGRNHAPQEIERSVDGVDGVRTGCAAAVAEIGEAGERLLVFVEVREAVEGQAEACRQAIRGSTGLDPSLVVLLEAGTLPRTSSGKIRRAETLRRWQTGELVPPAKVTPWLLAGAMAGSAWARMKARWGG